MDNILPRAHPQRSGNTLMILGAPGPAFSTGFAMGSPAPTFFDPGTTSHARSVPPIFIPLYGLWPWCLFALTAYLEAVIQFLQLMSAYDVQGNPDSHAEEP